MIVHYFNIMSIPVLPAKTDPPLVINPNAPLPGSVATELFKHVARRHTQKIKRSRAVKLREFAQRHTLYISRQLFGIPAPENFFRFGAFKILDHVSMVARCASSVKRYHEASVNALPLPLRKAAA